MNTPESDISIDLRSDTVTRPTDAMWDAMRSAPLGDDVLGDEPSVQAFEEAVAERIGKEAALFTPSGTMANQLAIRGACEAGDEIIAHRESHIIHYETGGPAALSGCMVAGLDGEAGVFTAEAVHAAIRHRDIHAPRSRMLVVENTHNRGGGAVWSMERFRSVTGAAREHGLHVHVDGARFFNAVTAAGYKPSEFAALTDTMSICFSKGLGAPVGSVLLGPRKFIDRSRRFRKMLGGGMRQSGILAAAGHHALDHHVARLADDHANAVRLADGIAGIDGIKVDPPFEGLRTNIVFFRPDPASGGAHAVADRLSARGVKVLALDPDRIRAITHLDVDAAGVDHAIQIIAEVARTT
ncbi:MAG: GntG family PLP-dependent aldolase [Planctomycetota bacterium]|jgi:threonine aldolase|nr:GntG family PLP-dependent aldolase [Planctomycetota bacterium]